MGVTTPSEIWAVGTDDSTGETIANGTENVSSSQDIHGSSDRAAEVMIGVNFTGSNTSGSLDVTFEPQRASGSSYTAPAVTISIPSINGRQNIMFGPYPCPTRYAKVRRKNNGGSTFMDVSVVIMPSVFS